MDYEHGPTPTQLKVEYLLAEAGKQITEHMQAERVRVVTRNEQLEAALHKIAAYPVHSEPMGGAMAMQDIALNVLNEQSPKTGPGAAGAQLQGPSREVASRHTCPVCHGSGNLFRTASGHLANYCHACKGEGYTPNGKGQARGEALLPAPSGSALSGDLNLCVCCKREYAMADRDICQDCMQQEQGERDYL
jgi:hypothetical protein